MASGSPSKPCSALKQLLSNPSAYGNIHERRSFLRQVVNLARCSPPGYTFCSLCRQLAKLSFEVGDKEDGIYNLVESHAVVFRHRALITYHRNTRKCSSDSTIFDKKCINFVDKMGNGYNSVLNRLEDMPKEWTIIQLSCVVDAVWRYGGPDAEHWTPRLHVVRLECGPQPEFQPLHLQLAPPPESSSFFVLKEIREMLKKNFTDHLRENKREFWKARAELDSMLKNVIDFMNNNWFESVSPLLVGRLSDEKTRKRIKTQVETVISNIVSAESTTPLSEEDYCLLLRTAENVDSISEAALISICARVMKKSRGSSAVKKLWREFKSLSKEHSAKLSGIKRAPVILIIDEKLECLPFELLDILKNHPVTRVPSLHALHGLYTVHRNSIVNGLKVVDSNCGFYVINPDEDLKQMEGRMSKFLLPRIPKWNGVVGQRLSRERWSEVIHENDIFVYMGHGGGGQYWNVEPMTGGIRAVSFLFGCRSAGYKIMRSGVEVDATLQAYQAAACPSIVGMLWAVTDKDTDLLAQAVLDACLPRHLAKSESSSETGRKGKKGAVPGGSGDSSSIEPEVSRAVILGRKAAKMLVTQAAIVVRGLPVCIE